MAANEIPVPDFVSRLLSRIQVAEGTMAFHFEKPAHFDFKPGQASDLSLPDPPETDSEGNTRTFSIASAPFENQLMFTTRMRDTAFKRSLKKVPLVSLRREFNRKAGSFEVNNMLANKPTTKLLADGATPMRLSGSSA